MQVLSIHGSKGLEWDLVAIPRIVDAELPSKPRSAKGWLAFGELPNEFKGDADELPELQWRGVQSQAEFDQAVSAFAEENRERHADEERRLAYVAVTRARAELLLTGSWWSTQKAPRPPSPFLRELVQAGIVSADLLPTAPARRREPSRRSRRTSALAARPARDTTPPRSSPRPKPCVRRPVAERVGYRPAAGRARAAAARRAPPPR